MQKTIQKFDYDYVIIGSGFGGSVSALRLSEKGYKVLVVEKGKWFRNADDFPKTNWNLRKWLWIPGVKFYGIMKMTFLRHVTIISGTGVGGGSLVYANTLPRPSSAFFELGSWAGLADWELELDEHYLEALRMLGAVSSPKLFDADKALKKLSIEIGKEDCFRQPKVAVYFGDPGREVKDPYFNGEGPSRTGCIHCGGCMTGCRYNSKNTLDKNYLYFAQKHGAEILAENEVVGVDTIEAKDGQDGYTISLKSSTKFFKDRSEVSTKGVVFSGGVLGTVKLLLKLKKKSLPRISEMLGGDIRTNNETLISVSTLRDDLDMSKGVAIGSILHTDDDSHLEVVRYSEGSGFWKLLHLPVSHGSNMGVRLWRMMLSLVKSPWSYVRVYWSNVWSKKTAVLLFMQTLDSTLRLKTGLLGGLSSTVSSGKAPSPNIPASNALTKKFAEIVNGKPTSFALETISGIPSTAHVLGGAVMADSPENGVINKNNEVFGYHNMLVVDGSMISSNPGVNPSLTITAIAERCMSKINDKPNF
jgi:cholesterol oxidase